MKGRAIPYSADELAWLEENRLLPLAEYRAGFLAAFGREDVTPANLHSLRKRNGWKTGRTGHFTKGAAPMNKGVPCLPGKGGRHPNARATHFRTGERQGKAVKLWKPVGTERVMDGYLQRKINDDMPLHRRWRAVHLIEWEAANGPIPEGHVLKCLDGDRMNTAPDNWQAVPRGVLSRLNGGRWKKRLAFDAAHPEVKPAVMALAHLEQSAFERRKGKA